MIATHDVVRRPAVWASPPAKAGTESTAQWSIPSRSFDSYGSLAARNGYRHRCRCHPPPAANALWSS
jgi:hypothetical protein